jgi:hypothetical protein
MAISPDNKTPVCAVGTTEPGKPAQDKATAAAKEQELRHRLVDAALMEWKNRMIDTSRRNPLLYYRATPHASGVRPARASYHAAVRQERIGKSSVSEKGSSPPALQAPNREHRGCVKENHPDELERLL